MHPLGLAACLWVLGHSPEQIAAERKLAPDQVPAVVAQAQKECGHGEEPAAKPCVEDMPGMKMCPDPESPAQASRAMDHAMRMAGNLGDYPMTRDVSGTSWQPDAAPMPGLHAMKGPWTLMAHGWVNEGVDAQGGKRGGIEDFSTSMFMGSAQRSLGRATIDFRSMVSADPVLDNKGYPLNFQTGETNDGVHPLVDRQHAHPFLMEDAVSASVQLAAKSSVFAYFGLPGEAALGPSMMRASAVDFPQASITHHWIDSTHVVEGVATLGATWAAFKLDGSLFHGREPDQHRFDVEPGKFDSYSARLTWNPTRNLSVQASGGRIVSPEQLSPFVDQDRKTASVSYDAQVKGHQLDATAAFGRIDDHPGRGLNAYLLESAFHLTSATTALLRAERASKDELVPDGAPLAGRAFPVDAVSVGAIHDFHAKGHVQPGLGGLVTWSDPARALQPLYGGKPVSYMAWLRLKLVK